jgi:endo-1,4-beta-xylanase
MKARPALIAKGMTRGEKLMGAHGLAALLALASGLLGCDAGERTTLPDDNQPTSGTSSGSSTGGSSSGAGTSSSSGGTDASVGAGSLAEKYADHFPIGAAVGNWHLDTLGDVLEQDFNHLTCENAMKIQDIHPAEATFAWEDADRIADFARQKGMKLTGHTLLWHRQAPAWMFEGVTAGDTQSLELLKMRLKAHIEAMVERYADVVDNWDVVNEALSDTTGKIYRDAAEGSTWYELFGSEEYIYLAFQYAKDALEANAPGSSAGKLYYNDYTATLKADKILTLLTWLKDDKGIQIDGVGFQSHEQLTWPTTVDLQKAIDKVSGAGYKVKISELDVSVYSDYSTGSFVAAPAVELTPELEARQAKRFADLFALYRKNKQHITSVTFWGVSDDQTWLDNEPVPGRNDYPLLYSDAHTPKAARAAIMDF